MQSVTLAQMGIEHGVECLNRTMLYVIMRGDAPKISHSKVTGLWVVPAHD